MTIRSPGDSDRLIAFSSPACTQPELHTHVHDDGVMRMRQMDAVDDPVGGEAKIATGGFHMMFIGLNAELVEGETINVTLSFEKADEVNTTLPTKSSGAMN